MRTYVSCAGWDRHRGNSVRLDDNNGGKAMCEMPVDMAVHDCGSQISVWFEMRVSKVDLHHTPGLVASNRSTAHELAGITCVSRRMGLVVL